MTRSGRAGWRSVGDDGCVDLCGRGADAGRGHGAVPGIVPSGFGDAVDRDVARVRAATARFKSTEAAEAAGYARVTDCVEHQPDGAMGYHFQNNALLDTTLDVDHPEVLVYERKPEGGFKLNGVEFLVPIPAWTATEPPRIMGQALKRADAGHLVPPCLDVGAQSERALCRLESSREVRRGFIDESPRSTMTICRRNRSEDPGIRTASPLWPRCLHRTSSRCPIPVDSDPGLT